VLADDWLDFSVNGLRDHFERAQGHVYLVSGPAHAGLTKLGKTAVSPEQRLKALNNASVLLPLSLIFSCGVHDRHWVEAECHRQLMRRDVARVKEFFDATPSELRAQIEAEHDADRARFEALGLGDLMRAPSC